MLQVVVEINLTDLARSASLCQLLLQKGPTNPIPLFKNLIFLPAGIVSPAWLFPDLAHRCWSPACSGLPPSQIRLYSGSGCSAGDTKFPLLALLPLYGSLVCYLGIVALAFHNVPWYVL